MGKMAVNYLVHTCPACGWSGQGEHPQPVPESVRQFVRERITTRLSGKPPAPWRRWEFHALIQEAAGAGDFEIGGIYLIAAQCARLGGQFEEEKKYRRQSIDHYILALKEGEVPEDVLYKTTYLVGELYRRVDDTWKSKEWFQKVLDMDLEHDRRKFFVDLTHQQMTNPQNIIGIDPGESEERQIDRPSLWSRIKRLLGAEKSRY